MTLETNLEVATLAGGCFWGMEYYFRKEFGDKLKSIKVGFTGGKLIDPKYPEVKLGETGHAEAIEIQFDPKELSYYDLVYFFWRIHDPTTINRQEEDEGTQYRSAIFYHSQEQLETSLKVKDIVQSKFENPIITEFNPATVFYLAEEYHQDYLANNPTGWCVHRIRW
ncbi:peptide methionine sulfoxide reductase [Neoconidiobolus thromboides FSU 785]|nr:peptide methionine sulfoxide reductase [Neoconidiobolus thromboides FSU 785]